MSKETPVVSTQDYLDKLQKQAEPNVFKLRPSMQMDDQTKVISIDVPRKQFPDGIEILALTDVQFGNKCCNVEKFIEFRDWILAEPNRFTFFLGDMIDAATVLSVGSPYENLMDPQNQVYRFVELAMPLRHRVLGFVGGNHERRGSKTFGDIGNAIATLLKIPYSAGKQYVHLYYGNHEPFKNALWHGGSGGRTKGAKAQMLHRFMCQGDSQCYWVGHLHDVLVLFDWRERFAQNEIELQKFAGVMSSSFLDHYGTYAEIAGMAPSDTMMGRVILEPNGHWEVTLR